MYHDSDIRMRRMIKLRMRGKLRYNSECIKRGNNVKLYTIIFFKSLI